MPKELLIIAYYFPPLGGVGAQRPLKFAHYLPEYGWRPRILTVLDDPYYVHDTSLLKEIPPDENVARVNGGQELDNLAEWIAGIPGVSNIIRSLRHHRPGRAGYTIRTRLLCYFEIPDSHWGWILPAYRQGVKILEGNPVKAIYTTSAPFSAHLIGYLLKQKTGLPWIADFRDEWSQNPYLRYPTGLHRWINVQLEKKVLENADRVIGISDPLTSLLADGSKKPEKFVTITNGFDESDIAFAQRHAPNHNDGKVRFTYAGSFYGLRSPKYFLEALNMLLEQGKICPEDIRVCLIGQGGQYGLKKEEWQQVLELPGFMEHNQALSQLSGSDVLLLFIPSEGSARTYPAKVFEYIALKRYILAMIPEQSVTAGLIRESRTGMVVPPEDVKAICAAIVNLYERCKNGGLKIDPDEEVIQRFIRKNITQELVAELNSLVRD